MVVPRVGATFFLWSLSIAVAHLCECSAWVTTTNPTSYKSENSLFSTPFELDYYEDPQNPYGADDDISSLACPPDTKLVIGLNKYTHDTSLCAADAKTGKVLFAVSKERLSRKKHDAGNVASMVEVCLDALDLDYDDAVEKVVMNNHHHRILPLENDRMHMQWEVGLNINGGSEGDEYDDEFNLLDVVDDDYKVELSHHLAHAYSTATQAPFAKGMVVVMDGMGETYRTMLQAKKTKDSTYVSDFSFPPKDKDNDDGFAFDCIPSDLAEQAQYSPFDWREAESVYIFEKKANTIDLRPVFKRFTPERSPPTLYNHGFENMDSVGALYSRASSHIFGDWNACGKVMGLAPWMIHSWKRKESSLLSEDESVEVKPEEESRRILQGTLYSEDEEKKFQKNKDIITGMPLIARMDADLFDGQGNLIPKRRYDFDDSEENSNSSEQKDGKGARLPTRVAIEAISLAHRIQVDVEDITIDFVKHFQDITGEDNLCIAGGVGLNSVLNGKLSRELGFKKTFISPYPGDDGIAVGCCAYGLFGNESLDKLKREENTDSEENDSTKGEQARPPIWKAPISPYLGPDPSEMAIKAAVEAAIPWLEVDIVRDEGTRLDMTVEEIDIGGVVALYQGRSELGPRALGHRSILADPRKKGLVRFINQHVKKRESFRPFAPSVLAEHVSDWFEAEEYDDNNFSPFMSLTAMVRKEKRARIPAVTHVDGSSRLQTVTPEADGLYHRLITKFFELTGVPMVLNTSFNTLPGEPIVESPEDAIRSFLCSMGSIEMLVMGDYIIKRKKPDLRALLGETDQREQEFTVEPTCPKRTGPTTFETTFEADEDEMDKSQIITTTRVRMPDRPMHSDGGGAWFYILDELEGELLSICDGSANLNEILAEYTAAASSADEKEGGELSNDRVEDTQVMLQNIVHRLVRLYEHTLISW
uniref:Carbamoyltransferase n=1 Tax=Pseudo-nitzschia australis TaxID=44445 RepID=A0A7S4AMR8_9STRA|mmetsp:Transcript_19974/g.42211  ORF Transcript_19974/g.42211 Transcript_19974/m.42211 type:complete len:931 (-) Transcript_19974:1015-3807(-)